MRVKLLLNFVCPDLKSAYADRDRNALDKALARAKAANTDKSLDMSILLATRLRDRLKVLERLKQISLDADKEAIGEIKRYDNPNTGVHQAIRATLILLGHTPEEVKVLFSVKCQILNIFQIIIM